MKDENNTVVMAIGGIALTVIIGGVVGLIFIGPQETAKTQQSNLDNLPALQATVDTLDQRLSQIQDSTLSKGEIEAKLKAVEERLTAIEGQVGRRIQLEVKDPLIRELDQIEGDLDKLGDRIDDHLGSPPARHR